MRFPLPGRLLGAAVMLAIPLVPAADFPVFGWPTDNHALAHGHPEKFYMHVDRNFEGVASKPWKGGAFGFTRTPMRFSGQVVETKFHEGIDVRPLLRDANGAPEDLVRSIQAGRVMHVNAVPGRSNYGNYVVVEHPGALGPLYSLYAHLARADVRPGQEVSRGETIGLLGWTGEGLNKERAHLHLELCLLLHSDFASWHASFAPGENHHGIYNGLNLVGLDIAGILVAQSRGEVVEATSFVRRQPVAWRAALPRTERFELAERYPWLVDGELSKATPAVEISFARDGQPLAIRPFPAALDAPKLIWVAETPLPTTIFTNRRLTKQGKETHLTGAGERYLRLIGGLFEAPVANGGKSDAGPAAGSSPPSAAPAGAGVLP